MRLRIHANQLPIRILGTFTGVAFVLFGLYSLLGGGSGLDAYTQDRAFWFGVCTIIAGVWAIGVSWLDSDLSGVWCRPPSRKWK
ncbi:MAG: hypothetical protein K0U93_31355 [Gammaproteobacteria bacterium]|nr:hypothetical protein [Gammaproteobacteria bacterium]